jgi:hypothetical protein
LPDKTDIDSENRCNIAIRISVGYKIARGSHDFAGRRGSVLMSAIDRGNFAHVDFVDSS